MTLPAVRVEINGELVAVAGADGLSLLTAGIGLGSGQDASINASDILLNVMGVDAHSPQPRQFTWAKGRKLKPGDRVTFQVVLVEEPSPPDGILKTPSPAQLAAEASRDARRRSARRS